MPEKMIHISEADLRKLLDEALVRHDELSGRDTSTPEARIELRQDMEFLRKLRQNWSAAAIKVGSLVLTAIVGGIMTLVWAGLKKSGAL